MSNKRSASCCTFTFSDGRRCRTPRQSGHSLFCSDHARRHDRINTADQLGREFAHFFSGRYLSACDLNTALGRLFAATVRGHVPAKTARTLAYLAQVMVQCIHLTEHEHAESFSPDSWRRSVRNSVNSNSDYLSPVSSASSTTSAPPPTTTAPPRPAIAPAFVEAGLQPSPPCSSSAPAASPVAQTSVGATTTSSPIPESSSGTVAVSLSRASVPSMSSEPAPAPQPNSPAEERSKLNSAAASLKSQLKQLLVSELAPGSTTSSQPVKPANLPVRTPPSPRSATGPSGLPLLAELPASRSQRSDRSSSAQPQQNQHLHDPPATVDSKRLTQ